MKKLARTCAFRLSKQYQEKKAAELKAQQKKTSDPNRFNMRRSRPSQIPNTNTIPPQGKKKVDNVNT